MCHRAREPCTGLLRALNTNEEGTTDMDVLKDWWWLFVTIAGIFGAIFRVGWKAKAQALRIDRLEECVKRQKNDTAQLVMASFAILDGLRQLNCNGNVTVAHRDLQNYIAQRDKE